MAKYLGETKSGSEAGTTYARNSYGQYQRRKAIPVNPNTVNQRRIRGYFSAAAQVWKQLTAEEQGMWASWAQLHPVTDRLGQTIILKGNVAFNGAAVKAQSVGKPIPRTPPADAVALDPSAWTLTTPAAEGTTLNGVTVTFKIAAGASAEEEARASEAARVITAWASTPRQSAADFVAQKAMIKLGELVRSGASSTLQFSAAFKDGDADSRLAGAATQFSRIEVRDETPGLAKTVTLAAVIINTPFTIPASA